jgi:hypothetical protein
MTNPTTITYFLTNSKDAEKFKKAMAALGCEVSLVENLQATVDYKFFYMANGVLSRRNIRTMGTKENA